MPAAEAGLFAVGKVVELGIVHLPGPVRKVEASKNGHYLAVQSAVRLNAEGIGHGAALREVEPVPLKFEAHALQPAGAFGFLAVFGPVVEIAHHTVLRQVRHGGGRGGACGKQGQQEAEKPGP